MKRIVKVLLPVVLSRVKLLGSNFPVQSDPTLPAQLLRELLLDSPELTRHLFCDAQKCTTVRGNHQDCAHSEPMKL